MTALDQQLMREREEAKAMNLRLISILQKQEQDFLENLQQQQESYENNISEIVKNYEISLSKIVENYESNLSKNTEELQSMQTKHETNITSILNQIKQVLDLDITSGTTGESYHEQLQNLKKQVWGLQQGQKELRTSLHNILTKMFPSQT